MTLADALTDHTRGVLLYGTTPPRASAPDDQAQAAADRLAARVTGLDLDGLVVYDVQDEAARTDAPRPFPFLPTRDAAPYGQVLTTRTGLPVVTYKCIATETEASWPGWLDQAAHHGVACLSLVGRASTRVAPDGISLARASALAAQHGAGFVLGGVVIAERHRPPRSESQRLIQKSAAGCRYFISQGVYDAAPTIALLRAYAADCAAQGIAPQRIVLDFVPVGRPQTMAFLRWLGIAIPDRTAAAILGDADPLRRSRSICCAILRRVLDQPYADTLPLGVAVESVSIHRDEIAAAIALVDALRAVGAERGLPW